MGKIHEKIYKWHRRQFITSPVNISEVHHPPKSIYKCHTKRAECKI
jgi:hypothetical protein